MHTDIFDMDDSIRDILVYYSFRFHIFTSIIPILFYLNEQSYHNILICALANPSASHPSVNPTSHVENTGINACMLLSTLGLSFSIAYERIDSIIINYFHCKISLTSLM